MVLVEPFLYGRYVLLDAGKLEVSMCQKRAG